MSKPVAIHVIQAQPGTFDIYEDDHRLFIGDPIIAWRIETYKAISNDDLFSSNIPLTIGGDVASNSIGIQNPDKTIMIYNMGTFTSLEEAEINYFNYMKA